MKKLLLLAAAIVSGLMVLADTVAWYNYEDECESLAAAFDNEPSEVELAVENYTLTEDFSIVGSGWTLDLAASDLSMAEGVSIALADAASLQINSSYGPASISGTIKLGVGSVVTFGENVDQSGLTLVKPEIPVPTFSATWTATNAGDMLLPVKITDQITQLSQIKKLVFGGKLGGGSMNAQKLFTAVALDGEDENYVTYQFQLNDYNHETDCHLKVSWVKFTIGEDGLYAQQIKKGYVWNCGPVLVGEKIDPATLPTSGDGRWGAQTGNNYAMMELFVASAPIATAVVREVEEGEAIVREAGRLVDAFAANSAITTLADITEMSDVLTADKMIIIDTGSIKITNSFPGTIKVAQGGVYDINWTNGNTNLETPTIVLAGGTLANNGTEGVSYGAVGISKISLTADSTIASDKDLYSIASNFGRFDYGLNGKTLTKDGAGQYVVRTPTLVGGGALEVLKGTLELADAKLEETDTLAVTIAEGATLKFTNQGKGNGPQIAGTINLKGGAFTAPSALELTVTTDVAQMEVVSTTANNVTTYSLQKKEENAAQIGEVKYATLEEALANLTKWETVSLLNDIALEETISLDALTKCTINLNGHTITAVGNALAFDIASGANVTIKGSGAIVSESGDYAIQTAASYLYLSPNGGSPDIGGVIALPAAAESTANSQVWFEPSYTPTKPVKIWADWTDQMSNSKTTIVTYSSNMTTEGDYAIDFDYDPIKEYEGKLYYAKFYSGNNEQIAGQIIYRMEYVYSTAPVTITATHATVQRLMGVYTDRDTGLKYAAIQRYMNEGSVSWPSWVWKDAADNQITFDVVVAAGYRNPVVTANGVVIEKGENDRYTITPNKTSTIIVITAEEIPTTPDWIDDTNDELVDAYETWSEKFNVTDPTTALKGAFALNCANTQEAVDEKAKNFIVVIEFNEGIPYVSIPAPEVAYNIDPVVQGKVKLTDTEWHDLEDGLVNDEHFFRAVISIPGQNK